MVDLVLLAAFIGAGGTALLLVWRKVPLLLQVPQQLIDESFVTRPSRTKRLFEAVAHFFRERRHLEIAYHLAIAFLRRTRLSLLRWERTVFLVLTRLEERERTIQTNESYWSFLRKGKPDALRESSADPTKATSLRDS